MVATIGLTGLRPSPAAAGVVTSPPYDVIKPGTALESLLKARGESLYHVILGDQPAQALSRLRAEGTLVDDNEPAYYVYEQTWNGGQRTGVFVAAQVTPYAQGQVIRHEKTFDHKVQGRIALSRATAHSIGPVFVLTKAPLSAILDSVKTDPPLYQFRSDFGGHGDLHGIESRVWRVPEASSEGRALQAALASQPFYIADGHHRYHASLLNEQSHFLCYVTEEAVIQAYNRVVTGTRTFAEIANQLPLRKADAFATPAKHSFCIYSGGQAYLLDAQTVPNDVVGRLDCAILEREVYPLLGLEHSMIADLKHFDYYPESALDEMQAVVDRGDYDLAIALHPVGTDELLAVADAGLQNSDIVMPEKSTFFAPKILSGLFLYRHKSL